MLFSAVCIEANHRPATTYFTLSDWLGSSRIDSTMSRTVASETAYAPFGETYATSGATDPSFTGQNSDASTGLYDFPARGLSTQGRWAAPDPAGLAAVDPSNPQSWNRYAYVLNNPLAFVDPTGLYCDGADGVGIGVGGNPGDATGIFTQEACEANRGTWIDPVTTTITVNADPLPNPGSVPDGPDLHGLLSDSSGGGWAWTFTKNFVSNFFSPSFYKQQLAHGGCLAVFQEAAGEPMQEIYHGAEVAGEVGAGLIGGAQAAGSLANSLYPMSLSQGTGPKLDPFMGPLVISGARSIASAASRWGFAAEHAVTEALPGATLAAVDTSLGYGLYREAQAAATGACH
jgi:RHS repeat-associated protein